MRINTTEGLGEQLVSQDRPQVLSHYCLLLHRAVILQREDQRVRRGLGEMDSVSHVHIYRIPLHGYDVKCQMILILDVYSL